MGKGNGGTRNGVSGIANTEPDYKAMESEVKRPLAENREKIIDDIKAYKRAGKVGEMVNGEIDRAVGNIENALKQVEGVESVNELYEADSNFHRVVRSSVARMSELADLHEHNMGYTTGRAKNTLQQAADALRMAAYEITEIDRGDGRYGKDALIKLEDIFRKQNKWK